MKAAVLNELNKPLVIEDLILDEPKADEVLVKVEAVAVCHTDVSVKRGVLPPPPPVVPGHEGAGTILKVGAGVPAVVDLKPGDKVVLFTMGSCGNCKFCWDGRPMLCTTFSPTQETGTLMDGTRRLRRKDGTEINNVWTSCFAEQTVCHYRNVVKIPANTPMKSACLWGCAATTGVASVLRCAQVKTGSTVAIFGMGGVGLSALLAAKLAGARRIICVDILDNKLAFAKDLGADYIVNAAKEDAVERIQQLTGGGADYCLEYAGSSKAITQAIDAAGVGGKIVVNGVPAMADLISITWVPLIYSKVITGAIQGQVIPAIDIPVYVDLMMQGKLPVEKLIARTMSLDEINVAFDYLEKGDIGRSVIVF